MKNAWGEANWNSCQSTMWPGLFLVSALVPCYLLTRFSKPDLECGNILSQLNRNKDLFIHDIAADTDVTEHLIVLEGILEVWNHRASTSTLMWNLSCSLISIFSCAIYVCKKYISIANCNTLKAHSYWNGRLSFV